MPYIINRNNIIPVNSNTNCSSKPLSYQKHDLNSVFTHWDDDLKCNISTPNELQNKNKLDDDGGVITNGESSK